MKNKHQNFKFNKKSPKSTKISEPKKEKYQENSSKKLSEVLEPSNEESKNNYLMINNNKSSKIINTKHNIITTRFTSIYSKNIQIELNLNEKDNKNKFKEEANLSSIKEKKYLNLKKKGVCQSYSEKNITKELFSEDGIKKNYHHVCKNINSSISNVTSLNKKIKINLNSPNDHVLCRKQQSSNSKKDSNKSSEKNIISKKNKKIEDIKEKSLNLPFNLNDIFGNKKGNEQIKHFCQNNGLNEIENENYAFHGINKGNLRKNANNNKNRNLNLNLNNSPEKIIIKINNIGSHSTAFKNKNLQKKSKNNIAFNSNDGDNKKSKILNLKNKKKNMLHNNTDNSFNHQKKKFIKNSTKKQIINNNNNISKNSSNSKINYPNSHPLNLKGVKVESINIDLNLINAKKHLCSSSQKNVDTDSSMHEKNNLTLKENEIPKILTKFSNVNTHLELSLNPHNESNDLNHSFKSAFTLNKKIRSLSKKRYEKKKLSSFKYYDNEEENERKLNDILKNLSNIKEVTNEYRSNKIKSEPKKLIDKIRKAKKMHKVVQ